MVEKISKQAPPRVSKGKRKHIRRLKQEARVAGTVYRPAV